MSDVGRVARTGRSCPNCAGENALALWDDADAEGRPPDRFACLDCGEVRSVDPHTGDVLDELVADADADVHRLWVATADENEATWGDRPVETLLLAAQEALGDLTRAHLDRRDGGDAERVRRHLHDLGALCVQLRRALDRTDDRDG